jgi:putative ABC transport system substrate-binding protein
MMAAPPRADVIYVVCAGNLVANGIGLDRMNRRDFFALLGSAASAPALWPVDASAQQSERVRRIATIQSLPADAPEAKARIAAFQQGLRQAGWIDGRNVQIEYRWGASGDAERIRRYVAELLALGPDVVFASGTANVGPVLQATRVVPIVFSNVADPVGAGFIESLSRPGGNATGFLQFEYGLSGKWLELLRNIAPGVTRVAVVRDAGISAGLGQFGAIQAVAPSLRMEVSPVNVRDAGEIDRTIANFAGSGNGGLIVTGSALAVFHRHLLVSLAARHRLPAVYFQRHFVGDGGLASYGPNVVEQYRQAAGYVDRILRGEKPADLPVQAPNTYELAINLKTAKELGLQMPAALLARADEVIE